MKYDVKGSGAVAEEPREENSTFTRRGEAVRKRADAPLLDQKDMQRRLEEANRPGPGHAVLKHLVGEWDAQVKCWMEGGNEPKESEGKAHIEWILDGHFLREDFEGKMMGQSFHGLQLLGFNNTKQSFNSVWMDDKNTGMFTSEGVGDSQGKVITLTGHASCPVTNRKNIPTKLVITILNEDRHHYQMFDLTDGQHVKTMEIEYTRA